ncbi:MAG TPA: M48 family metalloprotease [Longimicrobiales bacterium]|nr:M48 family metalloprotease [Longimicrobiales bacterium]
MALSQGIRRAAALLALVAGLSVGGCALNPATGRNQVMLISESQEIQMGREYDPQIVASLGLVPDSAWQRYINQIGSPLAAVGERTGLPWTFRVVDDPGVNAFAVPGGFIYVTRGLLAHLDSEAQLASVVGHEIGHVTARHTVSQMSNQQLAGLGLALGSVVSSGFARYAGLANSAMSVLFLKYSRDDERQADDLGLRYLLRTDWDPREMPVVFGMLEQVSASAGGGEVPNWLSTHPSPGNRRENIEGQIAALSRDFSGTVVNHDPYLQRLDGQVFGDDPREGYFRGSQFFHPEMRFRLTFPEGWTTQNGKQAVIAVSPNQDAVVELSASQGASADAAARTFLAQEGMTAAGSPSRATLSGLPTVSARFSAATENGTVQGSVLFVEHRGGVFGIVGYAPEARWSTYQAAVERALQSFETLTDATALNVQPQRVDIIRLERRTTIEELARQRNSPASVATLALINQVGPQTSLAAGRLVKWVVGQPLPGTDLDAGTAPRLIP